jgi:hypothetical protein
MSNEFNICVPKTWEFVHSTVCKFFADNEIKYVFREQSSLSESAQSGNFVSLNERASSRAPSAPYAIYSVNDEAIFTIMVYKEAVFYDNEFDIILHFNGGGGDRALMAQWFQDLKDTLLEIPKPANIACSPGECSFDDLI